jgi:PKD repeat protein
MSTYRWRCVYTFAAAALCSSPSVEAATIYVAAGGDLQSALNAARPGDTVVLQANAEFVGNFVLPAKSGDAWITVRTSTADSVLPGAGYRIRPTDAALLARLRSPNQDAALRTAPGAHHWSLRYLEFRANQGGNGDLIQIGDGSSAQNSLGMVPHHIILNHLYVHGDRYVGQKRCIALNAAHVTITDSHVADCKGVGQDTQAIGGWNGPGPYTIENNYLEAAGENVMFGGADPAIPNLIADGITIRRNYFSRPLSWRDPILSTPGGLSASAVTGGSLPAGVYGYRVVALRAIQITAANSTASAEVTVTTAGTGAVRVRWQAVPGASEYWVFGRTSGGQGEYWVVSTTEFIDTGAPGTSGRYHTSASQWTVKNLFELKSARNVVVQNNIFENHWKQAQPGWAIVFTPRNSQGTCTWCEVRNVRFEGNLVTNVAAGINILGVDNGSPSGPAAQISIKQNVFRMSTTLGGNAWFVQLGAGPRDVKIEHNTIDTNGNTLLYVYGGTSTSPAAVSGFEFISNAARHGSYGITGSFFSYGLGILNGFFPGYVWKTNYLAGASASRYPPRPDTLVDVPFESRFVNSAAGDYTVPEGSILKRTASDGTDIGADYPALAAALHGVKEGLPANPGGPPPPPPDPPIADFTASCQFLVCTFTSTTSAGSAPVASLSWTFGDGSAIGTGSPIGHTYGGGATYTVKLTATDLNGLNGTMSKPITVAAPLPPTAGLTVSCSGLTCSFSDASSQGSGTISSRSWTFGDGTPAVQGTSGTHTFATAGTYPITVKVTDVYGQSASATKTVTVAAPARALHVAYSGITIKLTSPSGLTNYWNANITVVVHDTGERPIAGATVTAAWTGAVVKTSTCVTDLAGKCVLKSGTLSYGRSWVTTNVTAIAAPDSFYDRSASHNLSGALTPTITMYRP